MRQNIRPILEPFVEKAGELSKEDFTKFMEDFGHELSYHYTSEPNQLTVNSIAPTQTINKSFLLTYRMFVQGSEHMRFLDPAKKISPELEDTSLSPQWLEQIADVTQQTHDFLREQPTTCRVKFRSIDQQGSTKVESPTRWDILETFLYGDYSHVTQRD